MANIVQGLLTGLNSVTKGITPSSNTSPTGSTGFQQILAATDKNQGTLGLGPTLRSYENAAAQAAGGATDLNSIVDITENATSTLRTVKALLTEGIKICKEFHQMPV
jgi:hypothetical protein